MGAQSTVGLGLGFRVWGLGLGFGVFKFWGLGFRS